MTLATITLRNKRYESRADTLRAMIMPSHSRTAKTTIAAGRSVPTPVPELTLCPAGVVDIAARCPSWRSPVLHDAHEPWTEGHRSRSRSGTSVDNRRTSGA